MKISEIYTAYVAWAGGGKCRPILIVETGEKEIFFLKITSQYEKKSRKIKQLYPLQDWLREGLKKQSYVDTGTLLSLPLAAVSLSYVGELTRKDKVGLASFIEKLREDKQD